MRLLRTSLKCARRPVACMKRTALQSLSRSAKSQRRLRRRIWSQGVKLRSDQAGAWLFDHLLGTGGNDCFRPIAVIRFDPAGDFPQATAMAPEYIDPAPGA